MNLNFQPTDTRIVRRESINPSCGLHNMINRDTTASLSWFSDPYSLPTGDMPLYDAW